MIRRLGKKGQTWMTEETLKVIVSVVVIVLLILLVWKIISIFMVNSQYEQAKSVMSEVKSIADDMGVGETRYYLIESPKRWIIRPLGTKLCACSYIDDSICSSKGYCVNLSSQAKLLQSCSIPFRLGSSSAYLGANCFAIYYVPQLLQIVREKDAFIFGDANTLITSSTNPWGSANSFWMIQVGNSKEYAPANIVMSFGDSRSLGYFIDMSSYFKQNEDKQKMFLMSSESNYHVSDVQNSLIGNLNFFMFKESRKGILYFTGSNGVVVYMDSIGFVDETGALWLDKSFLENLFDISSDISFGSEKKILSGYSGDVRISEETTHTVYRTNVLTSPNWGVKI